MRKPLVPPLSTSTRAFIKNRAPPFSPVVQDLVQHHRAAYRKRGRRAAPLACSADPVSAQHCGGRLRLAVLCAAAAARSRDGPPAAGDASHDVVCGRLVLAAEAAEERLSLWRHHLEGALAAVLLNVALHHHPGESRLDGVRNLQSDVEDIQRQRHAGAGSLVWKKGGRRHARERERKASGRPGRSVQRSATPRDVPTNCATT